MKQAGSDVEGISQVAGAGLRGLVVPWPPRWPPRSGRTLRLRPLRGGLALGACLAAAALDVWATALLARAAGPANDLFPRWFATRAWLLEGHDPYSRVVDEGIRAAMGGAPGDALGAFVFGFVYPGYVALLLAPLALLPFSVAATAWLLLAQAGVIAGAVMAWRAAEVESHQPPASPLTGVAAAVFFPASLMNLAFGQFAAIVFVAFALCWRLLVAGRPAWAGLALALALVKPSLALAPTAALLIWTVARGNRRTAAAWLACAGGLGAASLLAMPAWPAAFWRSTLDYARVASATSAAGLAASLVTSAAGLPGSWFRAFGSLIVGALAVAAVWLGWRASGRRAGDALAAGVLLGAWLVPPLYEWNSLVLLLPLLKWLRTSGPLLTPQSQPLASLVQLQSVLIVRASSAVRCPPSAVRRLLPFVALLTLSALTLAAIARWPSESRLIWPALVLGGWALPAATGYRGTKNATLRAGTSPSVAANT